MPKELTAIQVKALKEPGLYWASTLLYIQVGVSERTGKITKSWIFRYTGADGKLHDIGLGGFPLIDIGTAKELRDELARLRARGIDPLEHRRNLAKEQQAAAALAAANAVTLETAWIETMRSHVKKWIQRGRSEDNWRAMLRNHIKPEFRELPVRQVDHDIIIKIVKPLWHDHPVAARSLLHRLLDTVEVAEAAGYREDVQPIRKTRIKKVLGDQGHSVKHHAALPFEEAPVLMSKLRTIDDPRALALMVMLLTGLRTGEALLSEWDNIDFEQSVWKILAGDRKRPRELLVPLSPQLKALLRRIRAQNPEGRKIFSLGSHEMRRFLRRHLPITVHGFRATIASWMGDVADVEEAIIKNVLGHKPADQVLSAYVRTQRFRRRKQLMCDWSSFCCGENIHDLQRSA